MDQLIAAFRRGTMSEDVLKRLQINDVKTFSLESSAGVRPNPIRREVEVDVPFLQKTVRHVQASPVAGQRIGHAWMPRHGKVMPKRVEDDSSFTPDDLRGLNDVCTKWCTRTLFPDASTRIGFVANVSTIYNTLQREFSDLHFDLVFKGGVIMRLLIMEFLNDFPLHDRVVAERYLQKEKALSFSDFDFEIVPHNHSPPRHTVMRLFTLDFAVLMWLRGKLDDYSKRRVENEFVDFSWDEQEALTRLKDMLQAEVDNAREGHPLQGATIDRVVKGCHDPRPPSGYRTASGRGTPSRRDNVVIFRARGSNDEERSVISACDFFTELGVPGVPCDYPHDFYCTMNTFIGENSQRTIPTQMLSVFHLCRIKQGFVVYFTTRGGEKRCERLGGEVLDLSQSDGTRTDEIRRYIYEKVGQPYRTYYIIGSTFHIRSYSANGLVHDLRAQIHAQDAPAFDTFGDSSTKTRKRMLRYVVFFTIYVMGPFCDHPVRKKVRLLASLVDATASLDRLLAYRKTGVEAVDDFVVQEQRSLRMEGSVAKKRRYVSTMHRHFGMVTALLTTNQQHPGGVAMDDRYLEFADTFLY